MEQAAHRASGNSNTLATGVTSQTTARKKRFGGSSLTTWITMAVLVILAGAFFLYLLVPLAALLFHAPPSQIWEQMQQPDVLEALKLSFVTTAISTTLGVIFGLPAAIILARTSFPGHPRPRRTREQVLEPARRSCSGQTLHQIMRRNHQRRWS